MDLSRIRDRIVGVERDNGSKRFILYITLGEDSLSKLLDLMGEGETLDDVVERLVKEGRGGERLEEIIERVLSKFLGSREKAVSTAREMARKVEERLPEKMDLGELVAVEGKEGGEKEAVKSLEEAIMDAVIVVFDEEKGEGGE